MKFSYFPNSAARNSAPVLAAWAEGCRRNGIQLAPDDRCADVAVLWSQLWAGRMRPNQEIYQHFTETNRPVVIIDVGAIKRNHTWKITLSGRQLLAGSGHDSARREALGLMLTQWQMTGDHVIIALQRPDSNQWAGMPAPDSWLQQVVETLRHHTDRPIIVRPHPRFPLDRLPQGISVQTPARIPHTYDDFDFVTRLRQAWAVVNWNSTPGIIAVCQGIPAFVGESSLAAPVANLDLACIEDPRRPSREQWANDVAWTEWTLEEIAQGSPQRLVLAALSGQ